MDSIRSFFRTNSTRNLRGKSELANQYLRTHSTPDARHNSTNNLTVENDDNQSSSSDRLQSEIVKSFFLAHPSSTTTVIQQIPKLHLELETCSGVSTVEQPIDTTIAASAFESTANVRSFTGHSPPKYRHPSIIDNDLTRSWIAQQNVHHMLSSPSFRRTKSHRYPSRIRKHSVKVKHSTGKLARRQSQPFQSTYRQRNEEFRKTFKDLPNEERLIVDYSCAWQKDILVQGRMYLSQNYLCFYANILNWKSSLTLKLKDIDSIKREKTAKVISNAIEIKSKKGEKYFFASFVTRDKTFAMMERIYKYSQIDQPIPGQQLWSMIHENYGDDLDMTTDEEDNHHKPTIPSNNKYDRLTPSSIQSKSVQQEDDHSSVSSRGEYQTEDEEMVTNEDDTNQNSENIEVPYLSECLCQKHLATELINRTYTMSVEQLFDCIFGDNDFLVAYRTSRRIKDFQAAEWQINSESGKRERVCTYKVSVTAVIGSTTICVTERQVIDCELSKSHYIIDTEVRNEGIKYADAFFVASRYCLVQIGPQKSHLKVTGEVRYVKSLMAIIKTFIEKNAMAALQDSFTDLMKRIDQESSKQSRSTNNNNEKQTVTQTKPVIHRQSIQSNDLSSSINDLSVNSQQDEEEEELTQKHSNIILEHPKYSSRNTFFAPFCIITMLFLIIVNIFLCIKLNQIDQMTDRLIQNYPSWLNRYSIQQDDNQWSSLLRKQEEYYQTQLNSLQNVLVTTHNALKNVTNALNQLSQLSSGSS